MPDNFLTKSNLTYDAGAIESWRSMKIHLHHVREYYAAMPKVQKNQRTIMKLWHYEQKLTAWIAKMEKIITIQFIEVEPITPRWEYDNGY